MFWVSSDKYPELELLGHMVVQFLIFRGTSILFSIVAAPIYNPTNRARGFPFLHILASTYLLVCLWWPFWLVWSGISFLICISLMTSDTEHFFHVSLGPLYVLLGEVSVQVLCPFFNWIVCLLVWSCVGSLYIWEIKPLSEVSLANMFSHTVGFFWFWWWCL